MRPTRDRPCTVGCGEGVYDPDVSVPPISYPAGPIKNGGEMRNSMVLVATVIVVMIPVSAFAAPPQVVDEGEGMFSDVIPAGVICPFEVNTEETSRFKVTEFYNEDDTLKRVHVQVRGTTVWSSSDGAASENWAWNGVFDPDAQTFTQTGNVFNIHAGAGGVRVNDKGRIVIEDTTGDALVINGPHQAWEGDFSGLCEVLAP